MPPPWVVDGATVDGGFGSSLAAAGDVNGDGFADVLVAAPNEGANRGRVFLYLGSSTGLAATPAWTAQGESVGAFFGNGVAGVGDVNRDGYADVLVGAQYQEVDGIRQAGRVYLFLGSAQGLELQPAWTYSGTHEAEEVGGVVQPAGDVNRDGYADVVVSAAHFIRGGIQVGRAMVFHGSPTGPGAQPNWVHTGEQPGANFGQSAAGAADVNGDGYSDLLVGSQHFDGEVEDEGRVFLFLGSPVGLAATSSWTATYSPSEPRRVGSPRQQFFGNSLGSAGDVNGDGYTDVLIGAYFAEVDEMDEGMAMLYFGGPAGLSDSPAWVTRGHQDSALYGSSVAGVGDVNDDGFSDVVVGARQADHRLVNEGGAFVFLGSSQGLSSEPNWSTEGGVRSCGLGRNVTGPGDVNGDGYEDVLVAAADYTDARGHLGRVWLHYGGPSGLRSSTSWRLAPTWWQMAAKRFQIFARNRAWLILLSATFVVIAMAVVIRSLDRGRKASAQLAEERRNKLVSERQRLVRDLHDDVGSRLARLAILSERIGREEAESASGQQMAEFTREIMTRIRHYVWAVDPANDTLESLAGYLSAHVQQYFDGTGIEAFSEIPLGLPQVSLSNEVRQELVLCVREMLANALKHAQSTQVVLRLQCEARRLRIEVSDNGRGFTPPRDSGPLPRPTGSGNGLRNLRDRMQRLGGEFAIAPNPGGGTCVRLDWRLPSEDR